jgi:prepilin-type N-terminal cleavage/methylation domain-containing protein
MTSRVPVTDERGFTLIEVLVAMVSGLVVTFALFTILEVALHQTSRITDSVQAQQLGNSAITRVMDALHSACLSEKFRPLQAGSSSTKLIFISGYGSGYDQGPEGVVKATGAYPVYENEVELATNGNLYMTSHPAESGQSWPSFTKFTSATKVLLAQYVTEHTQPAEGTYAQEKYVFRYFTYKPSGTTSFGATEKGVSTLEEIRPLTGALSAAEAEKVAAVQVTFTTAPSDDNTKLFRAAEFNDQAIFAFGAPASESTNTDEPCD